MPRTAFRRGKVALRLECLETRALAAPTTFTFSFVPDGTPLGFGDGPSTMQRRLDRELGPGVWERAIDRAFQTWADAAGVAFVQVPDTGVPLGMPGQEGEIRIHGTAYHDSSFLAETFSGNGAGAPANATFTDDIALNFDYPFTLSGYDGLQSVLTHEIGHVLGLDHNSDPDSVMNPYSSGLTALDAADVQHVRAIDPDPPTHSVVTIGVPATPAPAHHHHHGRHHSA